MKVIDLSAINNTTQRKERMRIKKYYLFPLLFICLNCFAQKNYDLVIVGGNPGGIMSAISAARMGKTSVILERTEYVGGLPGNGLGATDIATRAATTGLFREFVDRIKQHYVDMYGANSEQVKMASGGYHFEPSVAAKVFDQMLSEYKDKITILTMRQFDAEKENISIANDKIKCISILNRTTGQTEEYYGKVFLDATYEGDLGAAAGIPFRVGREGKSEFNEPGAGRVYKYWGGKEGRGSTFDKDNAIQAYNYRLCLTNDPQNRVEMRKPEHYNREEYMSIVEDVWTGNHAQWQMESVTPEMMEENRRHIKAGNPTKYPEMYGVLLKLRISYMSQIKRQMLTTSMLYFYQPIYLKKTGLGLQLLGNGATNLRNGLGNIRKVCFGLHRMILNCRCISVKQPKNGAWPRMNIPIMETFPVRFMCVKDVVLKVSISLQQMMLCRLQWAVVLRFMLPA